jgi:hypothetical protein
MRDLPATLALCVASFVAGGILVMLLTPAPVQVNPIDGFCRGWTSGNAAAYLRMGQLNEATYQEAKVGIEADCIEKLHANPDGALAYLDGPLGLKP